MDGVDRSAEFPQATLKERGLVLNFSVEGTTVASIEHPQENQDAFFRGDNGSFGIFDGMGGLAGGEVASRIARDVIGKVATKISPDIPVQNASRILERAFQEANRTILQRASREPSLRDMGTTATVAVFVEGGKKMVFANVGDSRIYLARKGRLYQMTEDDSVLKVKVKQGVISEREAREIQKRIDEAESRSDLDQTSEAYFKQRNLISARLGDRKLVPRILQIGIQPGDLILGFSDGTHDNLTTRELERIIKKSKTPKEVVQNLKEAAYQRIQERHFRSKPDDITVVAARISSSKPKQPEARKASLNPIQETGSFQELFQALDNIGGLQGSRQRLYSPDYLKRMINQVRSGKASLENITRTKGLRGKVRELLEKEKARR